MPKFPLPKTASKTGTRPSNCGTLKLACASTLVLVLTACATVATDIPTIPQADILSATPAVQQTTVDAYFERLERAHKITWPILVANVDLCHDRRRDSFGIRLANDKSIRSLVDGYTLKQIHTLGYSQTPFVAGVQAGSPAALAGVQPGAVPVKVGDTDIDGSMKTLTKALSTYRKDRAKAKKDDDSMPAELEQLAFVFEQPDGARLETNLTPIEVCDIPVFVGENDSINASAGSKAINVRRGLLTYFDDDEIVGFVMSHEIAHVIGEHVSKQTRNGWITGYTLWGIPVAVSGGLFDGFFGGLLETFAGVEKPLGVQTVTLLNNRIRGTREFEREADYVGMYIAARAGLDISKAGETFARLAELSARSTYGENSHPVTADRMLALDFARKEIEAKQRAGEDLVPNGWPLPLPGEDDAAR